MPVVGFEALPDEARAWVFGAAAPVVGAAAQSLLSTVDTHLADWRAHGAPLDCTYYFADGRLVADLDKPLLGIANGQAMVIYDGDRVVGSATICESA